jgi:hypothetical protein
MLFKSYNIQHQSFYVNNIFHNTHQIMNTMSPLSQVNLKTNDLIIN